MAIMKMHHTDTMRMRERSMWRQIAPANTDFHMSVTLTCYSLCAPRLARWAP